MFIKFIYKHSIVVELIDQISSKIIAIKKAFTDLSASTHLLTKSFGKVNAGFHHTTRAIATVGTGLKGLKSGIAPVTTSVGALSTQLKRASSKMSSNASQLTNLKTTADSTKASIDRLNSSLGRTQTLRRTSGGSGGLGGPTGKGSKVLGPSISDIGSSFSSAGSTLQGMGAKALGTAGSMLALGGMAVKEYMTQEESFSALRNTLSNDAKKAKEEFAKLNKKAIELGNTLPGSVKDMVDMFVSLRKQGVEVDQINEGLGEATAKFAVLNNLDLQTAGVYTVKFAKAFGLDGNATTEDYRNLIDTVTRLNGASTIDSGVLFESLKYLGSESSQITKFNTGNKEQDKKLQKEAINDIAATLGVVSDAGIEGSMAGTGISRALGSMSRIKEIINGDRFKYKDLLRENNIDLDFYKDGKFIGIREAIKELEKIKVLSDQDQKNLLQALFGDRGVRPMKALINNGGVKAIEEKRRQMAAQQDTEDKIKRLMNSITQQLGLVQANFLTLVGSIGEKLATKFNLKERIEKLIGYLQKAINWLNNPKNQKTINLYLDRAKNIFKWLVKIGVVLTGVGTILTAIGSTIASFAVLSKFAMLLTGATTASGAFLAMATAGLLIYKYWEPLKAFFSGFWNGIQEGWKNIQPQIKYCQEQLKPILDFFSPVEDEMNGFTNGVTAGIAVMESLGQILPYVADSLRIAFEWTKIFGEFMIWILEGIGNYAGYAFAWLFEGGLEAKITELQLAIDKKIREWFPTLNKKLGNELPKIFRTLGSLMIDNLKMGLLGRFNVLSSVADKIKELFHIKAKVDVNVPEVETFESASQRVAREAEKEKSGTGSSNKQQFVGPQVLTNKKNDLAYNTTNYTTYNVNVASVTDARTLFGSALGYA